MAVTARCDGAAVSVFLDTRSAANVINLQTLRTLHNTERKHAFVLEPLLVRLTGRDSEDYPVLGKVLLSFLNPINGSLYSL